MSNRAVAKIIRDPIHEYISIYDNELAILDCSLFQRLRNIKQNGMAYYVYPSLTVNRFEHSLGVMHLADKMVSTALKESEPSVVEEFVALCCKEFGWEKPDEAIDRLSQVIRIVGLLHDLGHLPFSHTFEESLHQSVINIMPSEMMEKWKDYVTNVGGSLHEFLAVYLIENDTELSTAIGLHKDLILKILKASPLDDSLYTTLHEIIAGDIDADRGDYILRDGYTSGAEFGRFDLTRLVEGMRLAKVITRDLTKRESFVFRPTIQALSAVESLVIERYKSYRWLYHHHRVVIQNRLLEEITWRILRNHWDSREPLNQIQMGFPFSKPRAIIDSSGRAIFLDDIDLHNILRHAKDLIKIPDGSAEALRPPNFVEVTEFASLFDEVAQRKKRGVSLWKDIRDYKDFNDRIAAQIESIFTDHQRNEYFSLQGRVLPTADIKKTTENTAFALNWLVERLLARDFVKRRELEQQINRELRRNEIEGFLLLSVTFFKPWEYRGEREYEVFGRDGNLYHVSDVSPIVKQLRLTNQQAIKLYAYLVLDQELKYLSLTGQRDILKSIIEKTKNIFAEQLIKWTREQLSKEKKG